MKTEDWNDAFTSRRVAKLARKPPEIRKRQGSISPQVSEWP